MASHGPGGQIPTASTLGLSESLIIAQRALAFARGGQVREALDEYWRARQAGHGDLDLAVTLMALFRQQEQYDAALAILHALTDDDRTNQFVLREQGAVLFALGNFRGSSTAYDLAIEKINLGSVKRADIDDLISLYQGTAEAAREAGNVFRATILYANLADYLAGHGYRDRALDVRTLAEKNARASALKRTRLEATRDAAPQRAPKAPAADRQPRIEALLEQARSAFEANQLYAANEFSQDVIKIAPDYLPVHFLLTDIYLRRGHTELAVKKATTLLDVYEAGNDYRGAADACRLLIEVQPDNLGIRRKRLSYLLQVGVAAEVVEECWTLVRRLDPIRDSAERLSLLEHIKRLAGDSPEIEQALGEHFAATGQTHEACEHLLQAADGYRARGTVMMMEGALQISVKLEPSNAVVRERLADCLLDQGRLAEGIAELSSVSELYRKQGRRAESIAPLIRVAQTYEALEDIQKTVETYDLLLRLAPENAVVRQHFINFSLARGRTAVAARTLRALTEFFIQRNNIPQAIASLTQLISLRPDDPWCYVSLAELLHGQGAVDQATRVYERYLQRQPKDLVIQKKLQALRAAPS